MGARGTGAARDLSRRPKDQAFVRPLRSLPRPRTTTAPALRPGHKAAVALRPLRGRRARNSLPSPTEIRTLSLTVGPSSNFTAMRAHRYRRPAASHGASAPTIPQPPPRFHAHRYRSAHDLDARPKVPPAPARIGILWVSEIGRHASRPEGWPGVKQSPRNCSDYRRASHPPPSFPRHPLPPLTGGRRFLCRVKSIRQPLPDLQYGASTLDRADRSAHPVRPIRNRT